MALTSLQQRIVTAAIIAPVFIGVMWLGGWVFSAFITIVTMIGISEFLALVAHEKYHLRRHAFLSFAGFAVLITTAASLVYLRDTLWPLPAPSWLVLLMLMATVWATDICAYFVGRTLGGPKLAPSISPNKTWSGLLGGVAGAVLTLGGLTFHYGFADVKLYAAFGSAIAFVAQGGDLLESHLKRRAGVKDSGSLLPGHGGVLDRIDGLIFTAPLFVLFMWLVT